MIAKSTGTFYGNSMTADHIYTVAGNGTAGFSGDTGPATAAELDGPDSLGVDAAGNLVIADEGNCRVRMVADKTGTYYGQKMTAEHIYTVAGNGQCGYSGDGGPATDADVSVGGVAVDGAGNLVINAGSRIRVVAHSTGTYYGVAMTAGNIYTVAGTGQQYGELRERRPGRPRPDRGGTGGGGPGGQHADRRPQPGPDRAEDHRHALRESHEGRRHLQHGRRRQGGVLR